jgi:hypothetical protein
VNLVKRLGLVVTLFAVMLVTLAVVAPSHAARAQAETPTPTPSYQYSVELSSGATLIVERRITYGEIGVILAVLILLVGSIIFWAIRLVRLWLY